MILDRKLVYAALLLALLGCAMAGIFGVQLVKLKSNNGLQTISTCNCDCAPVVTLDCKSPEINVSISNVTIINATLGSALRRNQT